MTQIGLGLAAIGRPDYINIRPAPTVNKSLDAYRSNALIVLDSAYDLGIRHLDVAASYGYGEQFLLNWLNSRNHQDTSVSTKWGYTYVANWKIGYTGKHEIKEHSLEKLEEQWEFSKQLLPHLNLYQIHSATLESGVLANQAVLNRLFELKQKHQIKLGISTSGANQAAIIKAANSITIEGKELFDAYQVTYNVLEQSTYSGLHELIQKGKKVIIKEALANGRIFPQFKSKNYAPARKSLHQLADKYNVGIDAIALRFIIDNLGPELVLSGASNTTQLKSNVACLKIKLPLESLEVLSTFATKPEDYWAERSGLPWQ